MNKQVFLQQLDHIIANYQVIKSKATYDDLSGNVALEEIVSLTTKIKACVVRIVGNNSEYYKEISNQFDRPGLYEGSKLQAAIGIIYALKDDIANDYIKTLHEMVQSEVFSDYLDMAEYLLSEGYKDPAAVITGSTLEVHLKKLCLANNIPIDIANSKGKMISKKAEVINADLAKVGKYNLANQKQVTAWLDIRNSAAHGNYSDYNVPEIRFMIMGVRQFLLTYPS